MNWTDLKANVATWLGKRTDLDAEIVLCIQMAEAEFNRELRVPDMEATETDAMSAGVLPLLDAVLGIKTIFLTDDYAGTAVKVPLSQASLQQLRGDYPDDTIKDVPTRYAISEGALIFGPYPDDDYEVTYTYYSRIPALSGANPTNWLLTAHPDLYMAAAQWQAQLLLKYWDAVTYYRSETARLITAVNKAGVKKAMGASSIAIPSPVRHLRFVRA